MFHLSCSACGQKVEVNSFLAVAQEKCPHCGRLLIGSDCPPPGSATHVPQLEAEQPRCPRLAKEWERRGMITGALVGAFCIALIGALGGRIGLAIVGAVGGAMIGLLLGTLEGLIYGFLWGIRMGDHSLLNVMTVVHILLGLAVGSYAGSCLTEMNIAILVLAMLAGLVVGGAVGLIVGGILGVRAEAMPAEELPGGEITEEDGVVMKSAR